MAEYIEREAAISVLCDACGNAACPKGLIPRCSYYEKMQSIPAADVRHVVRAAWQSWEQDTPPCKWYSCDYCGFHALSKSNFCPNCGAEMEES